MPAAAPNLVPLLLWRTLRRPWQWVSYLGLSIKKKIVGVMGMLITSIVVMGQCYQHGTPGPDGPLQPGSTQPPQYPNPNPLFSWVPSGASQLYI